ncbi:hypothetical protein ACTHAL_001453 [Priestia flexa]|uniref:hypothetical protein n=1 Tax=Priestia flexa TaxID=86664 RepID=UPI003F84CA0A
MKIQLQNDYKKVVLRKIAEKGLKISEDKNDENMILQYYSYLRKKAFEGPHEILKSEEFSCPEEVKAGFEKLEKIIQEGGDIRPYFNRTASDLTAYDDMFADWGIMHFHLGDEMMPGQNLVKRGNPVLFAYMHDDKVYLINIFTHGHWSDKEVIQIMYNNWPQLLELYILKDIISISHEPDRTDITKLRKSGVMYSFSITDSKGEKVFLMSPGLGLNTARTSNIDSRIFGDIMNRLRNIEKLILSEEIELEKWMSSQGIEKKREITLELVDFNPNVLTLVDDYNGFTYNVNLTSH